jgi:hypothetical protein
MSSWLGIIEFGCFARHVGLSLRNLSTLPFCSIADAANILLMRLAQRLVLSIAAAAIAASSAATSQAEAPPAPVWNRIISTTANDTLNGLAVDDQGNAVVVGYTFGNLYRTRVGYQDAFYVSYNLAGDERWANQFGASPFRLTRLEDVTLGPNGDWFAIGNVDYRRGATHYGGTDVFVQRISPAGTLGFVTQLGTASSDYAQAITASSTNVFAVGDTYGSLSGTNAGGNDAFRKATFNGPASMESRANRKPPTPWPATA